MDGRNSLTRAFIIALLTLSRAAHPDPGFGVANLSIPSYERYTLKGVDADKKEVSVTIEYALREDRQTKQKFWEIVSTQSMQGAKTDLALTVRLADLQPVAFKRTYTYEEGSYTDTFDLKNQTVTNTDPKQFFCASTEALIYVLRAFPFASGTKEITVRTFGSRSGGFSLSVKNNGLRNTRLASGESVDAFEIELGVDIPFWSAFIPKSFYYFKNDPQKTIVKIKASFKADGKITELELEGYTKSN